MELHLVWRSHFHHFERGSYSRIISDEIVQIMQSGSKFKHELNGLLLLAGLAKVNDGAKNSSELMLLLLTKVVGNGSVTDFF